MFRPGSGVGGEAEGGVFHRFGAALTAHREALPELTAALSAGEVAAQFRRGEGAETVKFALHQAAAAMPREPDAPHPAPRMILVIDQLEELFTAVPEAEREGFGVMLERLSTSGVVWILASMRSDFFHHLPSVPALHELAAGEGLYHLSPPRGEEIEQIITRPAQAAGFQFEIDDDGVALDAILRRAAMQSPDALPLLEFALEWLYRLDIEEANGRTLRFATYGALGREQEATVSAASKAQSPLRRKRCTGRCRSRRRRRCRQFCWRWWRSTKPAAQPPPARCGALRLR